MKYKVGDKVRIKSLDWYNENKDEYGYVDCGSREFSPKMSDLCGKIATIKEICKTNCYHLEEYGFDWTDEMIEGCIESIEDRMKELRKMCTISLTDNNYTDKVEVLLNDYEYIEENGKAYFVKKKKEYPKTYEECCEIIKLGKEHTLEGATIRINYKIALLESFQKLLICRDAYWKLYGDEMGLGKPWEPDWENSEERRYSIVNIEGDINLPEKTLTKWILKVTNKILVFPTEEMRDAFKENFDPDIEICKELL